MLFFNKKRRSTINKPQKPIGINRAKIQYFNLKFLFNIIASLWLALFVSFIFYSPFFKITDIYYQRDDLTIDPSGIIEEFKHLKWKNIFFASITGIEDNLKKNNKRFKNISLKKKLPNKIVLSIDSFENIFIINSFFYKQNEDTNIKEKYLQKFFMSKWWELKPYSAEEALNDEGLQTINAKEDLWTQYAWDLIFDTELIELIQSIIFKLSNKFSFEILNIDLYKYWKELRVATNSWTVWITFTKDIDKQLDKIALFQNNFWSNKFSYLDLRINDRILFKE